MRTLFYEGTVEEFQVRDCATGDDESFRDFDAAERKFEAWKLDRPDHPSRSIQQR